MTTEQTVTVVMASIGLIPCVVFVVGYWWVTRGAWWRDEAGRFFMLFMGTLGVLFTFVLSGPFSDHGALRTWSSIIVFTLFIALTWWPLRLLWIAQRQRTQR